MFLSYYSNCGRANLPDMNHAIKVFFFCSLHNDAEQEDGVTLQFGNFSVSSRRRASLIDSPRRFSCLALGFAETSENWRSDSRKYKADIRELGLS
jgi:hypothetical protein